MFVLYFCRQKVPNKRWRGAAAEQQQQSRWQRRRSQADNVLPRLPQGPRLRRSVLVWVGSRPGLLGSAVLAVVPASSAVSQLLWTSVPGLTLTPARPQQNRWSVLYSDSWMWEDINIVLRAAWWGPHWTGFSAGPRGSCREEGVGRKEGGVEQEQYNNKLVVIVLSSYQSLLLYTSNNAAIFFFLLCCDWSYSSAAN